MPLKALCCSQPPVSAGVGSRWSSGRRGVEGSGRSEQQQNRQHVQLQRRLSVLTNPHHILFNVNFSVDGISPLNCKLHLLCSESCSQRQQRFLGKELAQRPGGRVCRGQERRSGERVFHSFSGSLSTQSLLKRHRVGTNNRGYPIKRSEGIASV